MKDFDAFSNTFQVLTDLNWISILIAFVAYSMLGGLWFRCKPRSKNERN